MQIKILSTKVYIVTLAARADPNPKGTLFKVCRCFFLSSKKAFMSYPHDF